MVHTNQIWLNDKILSTTTSDIIYLWTAAIKQQFLVPLGWSLSTIKKIMFSNQEEDEILHIDELSNALKGTSGSGLLPQRPEEILQSTTDAEEWHLEVERVAPQLKVTVRVDARDWRTHLEQVLDFWTIQFLMRLFVFHLVHHLTIKCICLFFFCIVFMIEI